MKSFKPKDGVGRAAGRRRRAQRRGRLPRPEAVERDACLDHRSGRPALPQGTGQGGEALLHRPRADGEPLRPAGRRLPDAGRRACRAGGGAAHDRAARRPAAGDHARRRQGLRRRGLRQRAALDERDAACRAEHQRPTLGDRRPHDAACRLRGQPAHPQADRGGLRLDQDRRRPGEDQVPRRRPRRMGLHLRRRRLQSGAAAEAAGRRRHERARGLPADRPWRIVEADLWDRDYLDLVEPACITFGEDGHGEIAFGALQAASNSNTRPAPSSSHGPASTRWTRSAAPDPPNSSTTAPSRSS